MDITKYYWEAKDSNEAAFIKSVLAPLINRDATTDRSYDKYFISDGVIHACLYGCEMSSLINRTLSTIPALVEMALRGFKDADPLEGRTMEEWLANEDKRSFWSLPQIVKDKIEELADGKPDGNLQWFNDVFGEGKWEGTNTKPSVSFGTTFRIKPKDAWEVAEDGFKLVTVDERKDNDYPTDCEVRWLSDGKGWMNSPDFCGWNHYNKSPWEKNPFAVPTSYEFETSNQKQIRELADSIRRDTTKLEELKKGE